MSLETVEEFIFSFFVLSYTKEVELANCEHVIVRRIHIYILFNRLNSIQTKIWMILRHYLLTAPMILFLHRLFQCVFHKVLHLLPPLYLAAWQMRYILRYPVLILSKKCYHKFLQWKSLDSIWFSSDLFCLGSVRFGSTSNFTSSHDRFRPCLRVSSGGLFIFIITRRL